MLLIAVSELETDTIAYLNAALIVGIEADKTNHGCALIFLVDDNHIQVNESPEQVVKLIQGAMRNEDLMSETYIELSGTQISEYNEALRKLKAENEKLKQEIAFLMGELKKNNLSY